MIVQFRTSTAIPIDSFALMGINVKNQPDAIGRFGTGLKYAVAVILRHGGDLKVFVDGVEYMFYLSDKEFRGKVFKQVRMKKRKGLASWFSSKALPFTTEFGKDWELWQAYRELESNTRDERGETVTFDDPEDPDAVPPAEGTVIQVDCHDFYEQISEAKVFLPAEPGNLIYSDSIVNIYDAPSKFLYYQGIRVYSLRYPARLTYDFKKGSVQLTEDRTAGNNWYLIHVLSMIVQSKMERQDIIYKVLSKSKDQNRFTPTFETMELNFDYTEKGSPQFAHAAERLVWSGHAGKSVAGYVPSFSAYHSRKDDVTISMPRADWNRVEEALNEWKIRGGHELEVEMSVRRLIDKIDSGIIF